MKKYDNFKKILIAAVLTVPFLASAVTIKNPLGTTDVQSIITNILNAVMGIVGIVAVAMIVYGGFQIMVSGGEEKKYESGKKTITYAVIGLVLVILSYSILQFIVSALGR